MMLVGVVAFNALRVMDPSDPRSVGVLFTGYFFQGMQLLHRLFSQLTVSVCRPWIFHDIHLHLYLCHPVSLDLSLAFKCVRLTPP